jgi:hypothetical protein
MMNKKKIVIFFIAITSIVLITANVSLAGKAAPYTKEAYFKIEEAGNNYKLNSSQQLNPAERELAGINAYRNIFKIAGYDFDATIQKVSLDLKERNAHVPRGGDNVATMIIVIMSFTKSHCEYEQVNCLAFFDSKTSKAVKWLWENTEFSP